ncbi:MAG: hypothetical protein ACTJLM_03380 [Ehrlichia sp.]
MTNYLYNLLLYMIDSPKLITLLALMLLLGLSYFFTLKTKRTSKNKKKLERSTSGSSVVDTSPNTKPCNKHCVPEHDMVQSQNSSFFAESVSQAFKSKVHGRSR